MLWWMGRHLDLHHFEAPPLGFSYPLSLPSPSVSLATWIGHSTYLLDFQGTKIITDPVFSDHCAPVPIPSFRRTKRPALEIGAIEGLDFVLQSHNHYDHLDLPSVRKLIARFPNLTFFVPPGLKKWYEKRGIFTAIELAWWESFTLNGIQITAVPAQHFSGRHLFDFDRSHWNGYIVEKGGQKLYFCGDTGYNEHDFKAIGHRFAPIDLSLIPIGIYAPRALMDKVHVSPEESVKIHCDVGSLFSLGMHWDTFRLSKEPMDRPPYDLFLAMERAKLPFSSFLPIGQGIAVPWG